LTPRLVADFRLDLQRAGVGPAVVRKTLAVLQSMLQRAVEGERIRTNPVRAVRKPSVRRQLAVRASPPEEVERLRAELELRDATLASVLAYAGLRLREALALQWRHVRERTLLVEQAAADGRLKGQKTNRPSRSVDLLGPLRADLAAWRAASAPRHDDVFLFARADGGLWREDDWRNWRKRHFAPAAQAIGMTSPRAYDLRHSYASLLIREGRLSIVELAEQMATTHDVPLDLFARDGRVARRPEGQRRGADPGRAGRRERVERTRTRPKPGPRADPRNLNFEDLALGGRADARTRTGDPFITRSALQAAFLAAEPNRSPSREVRSGRFCRVGDTLRDTSVSSASKSFVAAPETATHPVPGAAEGCDRTVASP